MGGRIKTEQAHCLSYMLKMKKELFHSLSLSLSFIGTHGRAEPWGVSPS